MSSGSNAGCGVWCEACVLREFLLVFLYPLFVVCDGSDMCNMSKKLILYFVTGSEAEN